MNASELESNRDAEARENMGDLGSDAYDAPEQTTHVLFCLCVLWNVWQNGRIITESKFISGRVWALTNLRPHFIQRSDVFFGANETVDEKHRNITNIRALYAAAPSLAALMKQFVSFDNTNNKFLELFQYFGRVHTK